MAINPTRHSSLVEEPPRDIAEQFGDDCLATIQTPPQGDDPERRLRAEALVAVADGRREPLEQLRSISSSASAAPATTSQLPKV